MVKKALYKIIFIASLLGLIISSYLAYNHYVGSSVTCVINREKSCNLVTDGVYSELLLGIPNSYLGIVGFLIFIILSYLGIKEKNVDDIILYISSIAFLFVLFLAYLIFFVINSFCIWCFATWILVSIILLCSITLMIKKFR